MATRSYTHGAPGEEVRSVSGAYVLEKEERVAIEGRDVLVVLARASFDTACCGAGGCRYALVPGEIVSWRGRAADGGAAVSIVEPLRDEGLRSRVAQWIRRGEILHQVQFW